MSHDSHKGWIGAFAHHKVAANILMLLMILSGVFGLSKLNTQFLPNFELDIITVSVIWPGATAEDVERSITIPLEQELKTLYNIDEMTSASYEGRASIIINFEEGSDVGLALDDVKERVSLVRNLPEESEEPEVTRVVRFENIAQLIIASEQGLEVLSPIAYEIKRDLLALGVAKVDINGLPEQEIAIQIPAEKLFDIQKSLPELANEIDVQSISLPAGTAGRNEQGYSIRSPEQIRSIEEFGQIALDLSESDEPVLLKEIATITQRSQKDEVVLFYDKKPALELTLLRTEEADSLKSAELLETWVRDIRPQYGDNLDVHIVNESWRPIEERINLLIKNGIGGLALILIILFLLLERRIAFWVAAGIPVSLFAAIGILSLVGGSINMISLFAMIMTLGIIVDDTIVVGENAFTRIQRQVPPLKAAVDAGRAMFTPVMAASLTTVAAFIPLMLISGIIGNVLFDIPLVAICVIIASVIECFLVLPGHIVHAFSKKEKNKQGALRLKPPSRVSERFVAWRETTYRRWITKSIQHRVLFLSVSVAIALVIFSLPMSGRIGFNFFPSPDGRILKANIQFIDGTPPSTVETFVEQVRSALWQTQEHFQTLNDEKVVKHALIFANIGAGEQNPSRGAHTSSMTIELVSPDQRETTNQAFVDHWRSLVILPPGIESFTVFAQRGGPPGNDIEINLIGDDTTNLKAASLELQAALRQFNGVFNIQDDLPYGKPQLVYRLSTEGAASDLTLASLGAQLRSAIDGQIVEIFNLIEEEVEVRVVLPDAQRDSLATLHYFPIKLPSGRMVPLSAVADFSIQQGLEVINHTDGQLTAKVSAEVDAQTTNANQVLFDLEQGLLQALNQSYGVDYELKGRLEDQAETFADMGKGVILALTLIYLILTWVFGSYSWPLTVMAILPFGIVGAIFGHWVMGIELTILSFFGIFGLSGIIVNDSIILVTFYRRLIQQGMRMQQAVVEASVARLRAVLLTSLTTIAGLLPLLFETSLQAQFLIPMAVSISFGLLFATVLVLFIVPILLYSLEHAKTSVRWIRRHQS